MANKKWTRLLALCMAVICTLTAVSAAVLYDRNGDEKTTVWDLQQLLGDKDYDAAVEEALGGVNELAPITDGVYKIYSVMGLRVMAKNADKGYTFKLMNDLDLGGMNWTPVEKFRGTFDGQGHTISNMRITKCGEGIYMGFFATVDYDDNKVQSVVKDLNLENVQITAAENAEYIGLVSGQVRGIIQDCTATGVVTDNRTELSKDVYIGTIAGRLNASNPDGNVVYTSSFDNFLTVNSGAVGEKNSGDNVDGITTKMGMNFAELTSGSGKRDWGFVGVNGTSARLIDETGKVTWNWQDISNSSDLVSQTLHDRREAAAQYMYDMGTVYWTPSEDLRLLVYKSGASDRDQSNYFAANLYRGIPYNHGSSSLERFNYWVNNSELPSDAFYLTDDEIIRQFHEALTNGTYTESNGKKYVTTLTSDSGKTFYNYTFNYLPSDWDNSKKSDGTYTYPVNGTYITGFGRYIGNDCSSAASWAWRSISAVAGTDYTRPNSTSNFFPSPTYTTYAEATKSSYTGIVPVGGLTFDDPADTSSTTYAAVVNAAYDAEGGADKFLYALSRASMGDCLMGYKTAGGHTLMLMGDAVTIRDKNGDILPSLSYVITTEQGAGEITGTRASDGKAWTSSWSVNKKTTYADLVRYGKTASNTEYRFFPVTCTALQVEDTPAATAWCAIEGKKVRSNFQVVSTTVGDETIYTNTRITGSRNSLTLVDPTVHEAFTDTVTVNVASGDSFTVNFTTGTVTKN